jgi:hypothetical protein
MEIGQQFGSFGFFASGEQIAVIFFQMTQMRFDTSIMLMFAFVAAHPAFG